MSSKYEIFFPWRNREMSESCPFQDSNHRWCGVHGDFLQRLGESWEQVDDCLIFWDTLTTSTNYSIQSCQNETGFLQRIVFRDLQTDFWNKCIPTGFAKSAFIDAVATKMKMQAIFPHAVSDELSAENEMLAICFIIILSYDCLRSQSDAHSEKQRLEKLRKLWRQSPNCFARLMKILWCSRTGNQQMLGSSAASQGLNFPAASVFSSLD